MAENGKNGFKLFNFVGMVIGGVLGAVALIYTIVYSPLNSAIAKECEAREKCDKDILIEFKQTMMPFIKEQRDISISNQLAIKELSVDMDYVKKQLR